MIRSMMRCGGALLALVALAGCGGDAQQEMPDQQTGSITAEDMTAARVDWSPEMIEAVDAANAAFSAEDYQESLQHFQRATELDGPNTFKSTAWFGVWMAQNALGDTTAAKAAMQKAQSFAPEASLIHGAPGTMMPPATGTPPDDSIHRP